MVLPASDVGASSKPRVRRAWGGTTFSRFVYSHFACSATAGRGGQIGAVGQTSERDEWAHREADVIASLAMDVLTSVGRFWYSPFSNAHSRSARAAGPGQRALCPWHGHSYHEPRRRRDGTLQRTREFRLPCCVRLSCCFLILADKSRLCAQATPIVAEQSANLVLIESARPTLQFKFSTRACALVSVPQIHINGGQPLA